MKGIIDIQDNTGVLNSTDDFFRLCSIIIKCVPDWVQKIFSKKIHRETKYRYRRILQKHNRQAR